MKLRFLSLSTAGLLLLWYFFDANLSETDILGGIGIDDQLLLARVLVLVVLFLALECAEVFRRSEVSEKSLSGILLVISFSIFSVVLSYPKLLDNTFLVGTDRVDLLVPLVSAVLVHFLAFNLRYSIESSLVFYKFRRRIMYSQVIEFCILCLLIIAGVHALELFNDFQATPQFPIRYTVFIAFYLVLVYFLSPRERIYPDDKMEELSDLSNCLDRNVELTEYVSKLSKKPDFSKKSYHKKAMKWIENIKKREEHSHFARFTMLQQISFSIEDDHPIPKTEKNDDEEAVLRVEIREKGSEKIVSSSDVKLKYVKQACESYSKIDSRNDLRSFLTPMSSRAYSIHLLYESDPNELQFSLISDSSLDDLKELIRKRNPDINFTREDGWTPLLFAVANGQEATTRFLLQKAGDPNISNKLGLSPLAFAADYGKTPLCKLLIQYGANVDQYDMRRMTPLMKASKRGHGDVVKLLLDSGADPMLLDDEEETALSYATKEKHGEIRSLLQKFIRKTSIE